MRGFTLIELLIVIAITLILVAATIPIYGSLQVSSQINDVSAEIIQTIRTAKTASVARYNNESHGVRIFSDRYVLYQGSSYALRDANYDREIVLDASMTLSGLSEINFSKGLGFPDVTGTINIVHSVTGARIISINSYGLVQE